MLILKTIPSIQIIPDSLNIAFRYIIPFNPTNDSVGRQSRCPPIKWEESETQWVWDLWKAEPGLKPRFSDFHDFSCFPKHRTEENRCMLLWFPFCVWTEGQRNCKSQGEKTVVDPPWLLWLRKSHSISMDFRHVMRKYYPSESSAKFLQYLATISLSFVSVSRPLFRYLNHHQLTYYVNRFNFCGLLKSSEGWHSG